MDLYGIKEEKGLINFGFYARNPEDIINALLNYKKRKGKNWNSILQLPRCPDIFKTFPKINDIQKMDDVVYIMYHMGSINFNPNELDQSGDFFRERIRVVPNFEIACSPESVELFARHRFVVNQTRIGKLYELSIEHSLFGGLYYIPKDIAKAMVAYDLSPHLERNRVMRRTMNSTYDNHPGLARIKP